jgi:ABC-type transport system involved in multi-copper enzyme maturation permease subunit
VVGSLGTAFKINSLTTIGDVARYILSTDGLWHGAIYYLEPQSFVAQRLTSSPDSGNPFFAQGAPTWTYLIWVGVWFLAVLAAGIFSFERREL